MGGSRTTDYKLNLKPCPFCGRDVNTVSYSVKTRSFGDITMSLYTTLDIQCQCGLRMEIRSENVGGKDVMEVWNTRADIKCRTCIHHKLDYLVGVWECELDGECKDMNKWERKE